MRSGLHAANQEISHSDMATVMQAGGFTAAKLLQIAGCRHTTDDALWLLGVEGVESITVRLPDSYQDDGHPYDALVWANKAIGLILAFYHEAGVRRFQCGNECNWLWRTRDYGPWQNQFFWRKVVSIIRPNVPADIVLISSPLSFAPALWTLDPERKRNPTEWILDDWLAAYQWTDKGRQRSVFQLFTEVGANVYWQSDAKLNDPSYGGMYTQLHERSQGMPVSVLEYGNSMHEKKHDDGTIIYTPEEVEKARVNQYPKWLRDARDSGYVTDAFMYISPGATQDWDGYKPTSPVLGAVARALVVSGVTRISGNGRDKFAI